MTSTDPTVVVLVAATPPVDDLQFGEELRESPASRRCTPATSPASARVEHVGVGPSGVWVIDAHDVPGPVVRRDRRLFVGAQDRSDLLVAIRCWLTRSLPCG